MFVPHLHRTAASNGGTLRTAKLPLMKLSERFASDRGPLHLPYRESSASMSGHGRKFTGMEPSFVI
jgi:hypothetical protein